MSTARDTLINNLNQSSDDDGLALSVAIAKTMIEHSEVEDCLDNISKIHRALLNVPSDIRDEAIVNLDENGNDVIITIPKDNLNLECFVSYNDYAEVNYFTAGVNLVVGEIDFFWEIPGCEDAQENPYEYASAWRHIILYGTQSTWGADENIRENVMSHLSESKWHYPWTATQIFTNDMEKYLEENENFYEKKDINAVRKTLSNLRNMAGLVEFS